MNEFLLLGFLIIVCIIVGLSNYFFSKSLKEALQIISLLNQKVFNLEIDMCSLKFKKSAKLSKSEKEV